LQWRNKVTYTSERFDSQILDATCSNVQKERIKKGIVAALPYIEKGIADASSAKGKPIFNKWFGTPSSSEPDSDVMGRMNDAVLKLKTHDWENLCCPSSGIFSNRAKTGACYRSCGAPGDGSTTLAFVTSSSRVGSADETQFNGIYWCARTFSDMSELQMGFVAFHEAIHMVSRVGDGSSDYSKEAVRHQAEHNPEKARITAQSYTLYAMQAGLDYEQYSLASASWGPSVSNDGKCKDRYSNCATLAKTRSCNDNGNELRGNDNCCHACLVQQPPGSAESRRCFRDKYNNCARLVGGSKQKCASGILSSGEAMGISCCKTCEGLGVMPEDSTQ